MRSRFALLVAALVISLILNFCYFLARRHAAPSGAAAPSAPATKTGAAPQNGKVTTATSDMAPTAIYAHNLLLRKGPDFRIYVRWLRGEMTRSRPNVDPSFDNPDSFFLDVKTGVVRANMGDIGHLLNATLPKNSPLKDIKLSGKEDQIKLDATLHKVVPLPIEMMGTLSATPDNRIQIHVTKLSVLKVPLKGLLRDFHVTLADLFQPKGMPGIQVTGNDIFFDTLQLLPPPHIRGQLTKVHVVNPDLVAVYGSAKEDVQRVEQWRNFLRFHNGTIDFGKLTMHQVDIIMIDLSNDAWFDLDLANYQKQLVNGYTHMTPAAGLQIFMPDLDEIPQNKTNKNISIEWLKNRNAPPPAAATSR